MEVAKSKLEREQAEKNKVLPMHKFEPPKGA